MLDGKEEALVKEQCSCEELVQMLLSQPRELGWRSRIGISIPRTWSVSIYPGDVSRRGGGEYRLFSGGGERKRPQTGGPPLPPHRGGGGETGD